MEAAKNRLFRSGHYIWSGSQDPELALKSYERAYNEFASNCLESDLVDDANGRQLLACHSIWRLSLSLWPLWHSHGQEFVPSFLQWIKDFDLQSKEVDAMRLREECIEAKFCSPEVHPDYWKTIFILILQGETKMASELLEGHSLLRDEEQLQHHLGAVALMEGKMLIETAVFGSMQEAMSYDSRIQQREWKSQCRMYLDRWNNAPVKDEDGEDEDGVNLSRSLSRELKEQIIKLARILNGDVETMREFVQDLDLVVAQLLIMQGPSFQPSRLPAIVENSFLGSDNLENHSYHRVVYYFLTFDMINALRAVYDTLDDPWSALHLTQVFSAKIDSDYKCKFVYESALILTIERYGATAPDIAASYLKLSDYFHNITEISVRTEVLRTVIESQHPLTSEKQLRSLLHAVSYLPDQKSADFKAKWRDATESIASDLQAEWGIQCYRKGRGVAGLYWLSRSQRDKQFAAFAQHWLREHIDANDVSSGDLQALQPLLENERMKAQSCQLSSALEILKKFQDLRSLMHDALEEVSKTKKHVVVGGKPGRVAKQIIQLLDTTERQFWTELLVYALPLLEAPCMIFTSKMTLCLMRKLQDLLDYSKILDHEQQSKFLGTLHNDAALKTLRLALGRNLARANVWEAKGDWDNENENDDVDNERQEDDMVDVTQQ